MHSTRGDACDYWIRCQRVGQCQLHRSDQALSLIMEASSFLEGGRISIVVSISPNHFTRYGIPATAFQPAPKILLYNAFIFQILAGF